MRGRLPSKRAAFTSPQGARFRTSWEHHGYSAGGSTTGTYWSRRIRVPVDSVGGIAPLGTVWEGTLSSGLRVRIPLVVVADSPKTLSEAKSGDFSRAGPRPEGWFPSGDDRSTRLADVLYAVGVLDHFFPYKRETQLELGRASTVALREAATAKSGDEFTLVLEHLSSVLRDGHSWVTATSGKPGSALPVQFEFIEGQLAVVAVDSTSLPIRVGDVVTRIGNTPTASAAKEMSRRVSAATPGYLRHRVATRLALSDSAIAMRFRAADGTEYSATLKPIPGASPSPHKPAKITMIQPGIWYVDIDRITDADWTLALDSLMSARGIVFDLRGYPRGGVRPLMALASDSV